MQIDGYVQALREDLARVAALGAEAHVRPLHGAPARNSAYSTIARSAATARCALG